MGLEVVDKSKYRKVTLRQDKGGNWYLVPSNLSWQFGQDDYGLDRRGFYDRYSKYKVDDINEWQLYVKSEDLPNNMK